ncbi:ApeA N-terminal domain 1-containing protein [Catellatospora coxensis]|uniref:ApeA N-terminal domain-containing protein n=1 Tax=Catellatospora coxensis TaxID=310354 RepID=A0A8J3L1W9_9ACTN|nr:HEPN domain-containing protein [Catellatospora coxensis]GIG09749.1 hypothetical protein Cco03nite_64490 [Catellatospora coxensis]
MSEFEVVGDWWLPGREDRKLPGTLTWSAESGGVLKLIGGVLLDPMEIAERTHRNGTTTIRVKADDLEAAGTYERIYGAAEGRLYTLDESNSIKSVGSGFGNHHYQIVKPSYVFRGHHFPAGAEPEANKITIALDMLEEWVSRSGMEATVTVDHEPADGANLSYEVRAQALPPDSVPLDDGGTLTLRHRVPMPLLTGAGAELKQWFVFSVSYPGVRPTRTLTEVASDLQDLVSIATGRTVAFDTLGFRHPDVYREIPADRPNLLRTYPDGKEYRDIRLWARWTARREPSKKPLRASDLYFTLADLGDLEGVARWLGVARRHGSSLARVMSTRYGGADYLHNTYLSRVAALEGMDTREHGGSAYYRQRIKRCADLAGKVFTELVGDVDAWVTKIKDDRNDMAHHKGVRLDKELAEQYYLSETAYWLYVFCLLRLADAPEVVFEKIEAHEHYRHLKRKSTRP